MLSLLPLAFWITLMCLSVYAALLIGHWPQVSIDDPKYIAEDNYVYGACFYLTTLNFFTFGFSVILAPSFIVIAWFTGAGSRIAWPILLFLTGLAMFFLDPGQRIEWFID